MASLKVSMACWQIASETALVRKLRAAKKAGVPIVVNTDAHAIAGLDMMRFGIKQARRAGLTKEDVLNPRPWAEIKKALHK